MSLQTKYLLEENQMPKFWYNIQADLPKPAPAVLASVAMMGIIPAAAPISVISSCCAACSGVLIQQRLS